MANRLRLSDLSAARQGSSGCARRIDPGGIENLEVRSADQVFAQPPLVMRDVKLDQEKAPRPELTLSDFAVADKVRRLMSLLDDRQATIIRKIEVRAGVPQRTLLRLSKKLNWCVLFSRVTTAHGFR